MEASRNEPNTLKEAKAIIQMKNTIINKMKNQITNYTGVVFSKDAALSDTDQNVGRYLRYEISRLESKLLLYQTELNAEKARADQIREVNCLC